MTFQADLEQLRHAMRMENWVLTEASLAAVEHFRNQCLSSPENTRALNALTPELEMDEFFVNVHADGTPVSCSPEVLAWARVTRQAHPEFVQWFRETPDCSSLLVARWLAHVAGFRHRAVHLFLDHPTRKEYTFVQLRSFDKCGYPGCFDIPVGGHIKDSVPVETSLAEELHEELGFDLARDVDGLALVGTYDYADATNRAEVRDMEHRTLYVGTLREEALGRAHFTDGEVAALCLFSVHEIQLLLRRHPEQTASGLLDSFQYYLDWREGRA
jgi:8-oxo-dGTP pyrophosphatase MutT (NUDIX family)